MNEHTVRRCCGNCIHKELLVGWGSYGFGMYCTKLHINLLGRLMNDCCPIYKEERFPTYFGDAK